MCHCFHQRPQQFLCFADELLRMSTLIFLSVYLFICNKTCVAAIVGTVAVVININNTIIVGCLRGYLSAARCRLAYGPADATATHFLLL